ncbi:MAG: N-acetylneuraminate synthase family protein [Desulfamplus sp.]|nr:N-acetylneuraminate synthase family protein [Desulfamplus sp.]
MIIDKNYSKYIVFNEESILVALRKIDENEEQIIFAVNSEGILEGVLTDGDFRRWLLSNSGNIDLEQPVCSIANKRFKSTKATDNPDRIRSHFSDAKKMIPLLDEQGRVVAIAKRRTRKIMIDHFEINDESPSFIIAEIGNNHNGDFDLAKHLVDLAKESGADCAKFQMRNMQALYRNAGNADDIKEDLGSQYTLDLLSRFQLSDDELFRVFDYCKDVGILPLCTPWDIESYQQLENYGMPAFKTASADFTNHDLLEVLAKSGKPLICSTGMSTEEEIIKSVELLKYFGAQYILLNCNSTYPTPFKDVNLRYLDRLQELGNCYTGYSGHERGYYIPLASIALGAKVIEKHFTIDRSMEGNDHRVSLLPDEFKQMVEGIRQIEISLGNTNKERVLTQGELINRETLGKSLIINCNLKKGEQISEEMLSVKSPGKGLSPYYKKELIGRSAKRDFLAEDFFYPSDIEAQSTTLKSYSFSRPWGVPIRYHDLKEMKELFRPDLLEFHLSYKDLDAEVENYFDNPLDMDFVVHAPELFANDHLLNLCTDDEKHRQRSVCELQKVIDVTRSIKAYFKKSGTPLIIVNVGGFSRDTFIQTSKRQALYKRLENSFNDLDSAGVEIIPQTMPPFPWLFGGQQYHNLFMDPKEIVDFCERNQTRICLDISHSKLACNQFHWSFEEFLEIVAPFTAHMHIVDAKGVDGEGLQIEEGEIDFYGFSKIMKKHTPESSFIPEIWQGHKNFGEGFRIALERLEKYNF